MQTYYPVPATPAATQPDASAALKRLVRSISTLSDELLRLPKVHQALVNPSTTDGKDQIEQEIASLVQQIDAYWREPSALGQSRRSLFANCLADALHDEAILKSHEGDLGTNAVACLPLRGAAAAGNSLRNQPSVSSLHVQFNEQTLVEIKGALIMSLDNGRTLLALPGTGLTEFASQQALLETTAQWLNDEVLRWALLINADQRHQEAALAVANDPELFISKFSATDMQLQRITGNPFRHALHRQIDKQREDVRYLGEEVMNLNPQQRLRRIEGALRLSGMFGPSAMLERREQSWIEQKTREGLPHWLKIAPQADRVEYTRRLQRYEQAREALSSALNGAASAEQYAEVNLRTCIANDLGHDLEPGKITVSTSRTMPITGENYTVTRQLPQLALYGLHPNDQHQDSEFLTGTTISIDDVPAETACPELNPAYIAKVIEQLELRIRFGDYQRATFGQSNNQRLMRELLRIQMAEQAYAAKMQGHISMEDFAIIEAITESASVEDGSVLGIQQIKIDNSDTLGRILVFRKENANGGLERLIMFTSDAPHAQLFRGFHNEAQLRHELVGWTDLDEMRDYMLQQLPASRRPSLTATLEALRQKPQPRPDFIQLLSLESFDAGLSSFVSQLISVTCANNETHTPSWCLRGTDAERKKLVALEDALEAAVSDYETQPHTKVTDFEDYVHQRASEKICQLLNAPAGTVNPDTIIIISERETLTYTQMIRNGYDDTLGFLNPAADTTATFKGPEGLDLSALTPASVTGSVRGKWLADSYAALIRRTLLDPASVGYEYRRQTSVVITRLQMEAAALRSLLKGHIDASQYQWLALAICNVHSNDADLRSRHPVYPLKIHVDKPFIASRLDGVDQLVITDTNLIHVETVQGCFALLPTNSRHSALLYTPKAPDGVEFRLFSSFVESLNKPGMIDYYKDRCRVNARRILSFFLKDMQQGNAAKAPYLPRESITDFAQVCFNRPIERKLRDVEETTIGRSDMLSNIIWTSVDIIATVLTLPFPPASFVVGVALSLRDSFEAAQALAGHSPDDANLLILASVLNMAGAAGDASVGLKGFGRMVKKLAKDSSKSTLPAALRTSTDFTTQPTLFPVTLQDEPFLISKPNINGQAPMYRSLGFDTADTYATGQYAVRDSSGAWQPLAQPSTSTVPTASNVVSANRAVDISLHNLPKASEGHALGVSLGNDGRCYIAMNDLVYQVHYDANMRCWNIVDPQNPFAFFGRQPVTLNPRGQWELVERTALRGGGNLDQAGFTPLRGENAGGGATATGLQQYELPRNLQPHMVRIIDPAPVHDMGTGLDEYFEAYYSQMRQNFFLLKENLYRDARAFFSFPAELPPRPTLPAIDPSTTVASFFDNVFTHSNGLVLSEAPKSIASKRLLMTHMQALVEQRVEVLYIPHLFTDKHVRKLAKYYVKGRHIRSGSHEIKNHLEFLNNGALDNLSRQYDYYHLIKEAHRHNIEVRPLSSSVSYPLDAFPVATAELDSAAAEKMSKFFGHKVISADVAADPSKRWIALVDKKLATFHDQTPGLAELHAAISVHIEDVSAGTATRISRNSGVVEVNAQSTPCDFNLEFAAASLPEPATRPAIVGSLDNAVPTNVSTSVSATSDNAHVRDFGLRWNEVRGWQRISSQEWIAETPPTALQLSFADAAYEMPLESRRTLHDLAYNYRRGLDEEYFFSDETLSSVREQFFVLRDKLNHDAKAILSDTLPPRPVMPAVEPPPSAAEFVDRLYTHSDGMVIGEFHDSIASKKFIIDNLPLLAQKNVKTLYLEHLLTDLHQAHLDRFFDTGRMSNVLLDDIRVLDRGHLTDPAGRYTFEKLIIKAQQHGLELRAIDCTAGYHLKGMAQATATSRQQMMNYFASRTIRRHQAVMGPHKWVALVGNSHSNTYANAVPGIAELEGAIGLRVIDVSPGTPSSITVDTGESVNISLSNRTTFIKGDFKVQMEVVREPVATRAPQRLPLEVRLTKPGMFVTEQKPGNLHFIIHRSRDNAIHRTPVQLNAAGKVYVDRPSWTAVHMQPYDDVAALISALEGMNLTRVG